MDPITMGIASAGLSALTGFSQRAAQTRAAKASYASNFAFINQGNAIAQNDLQLMGQDINNELGMQLTALAQEIRTANADVTASQTERNVFGNTAARMNNVVEMKGALSADALQQAAEAQMVDLQNQMRTQKYNYERQHAENKQNFNNAMSQRQSTLGILAGAASAGLSGYSAGMNLAASKDALAMRQSMRDLAQKNAQATGARLSRLINLGN